MLSPSEIEIVKSLALKAGAMLRRFSKDPVYRAPNTKIDGSVVTKADIEVSQFLVSELESLGAPVVSEEGDLQLECQTSYFLVDPLDGTKYFVDGEPDYAVLIGYIGDGVPEVGVICEPEKERIVWAAKGAGCFVGDQKVAVKKWEGSPVTAYSSGFHKKKIGRWLASELKIGRFFNRGSMLKFCDIVEGHVDLYPRFGPTGEWDTAAAQIILEEAGYGLVDLRTGAPLVYGKPGRLNSGFLAGHRDLIGPTLTAMEAFFKNTGES